MVLEGVTIEILVDNFAMTDCKEFFKNLLFNDGFPQIFQGYLSYPVNLFNPEIIYHQHVMT